MMMPILKVVEELEAHAGAAEVACGYKFVQACLTAARYLVEQGEEIVDLKADLAHAQSDREYLHSRMKFFAEVAGLSDKVIAVEGYKAFRGTMKIRPKTASVPSFELSGDWLYKPETDCWYGKGSSFAADICTVVSVDSRPQAEWEPRKDVIGFVCCSNCRDCNTYDEWPNGKKWNFCPNCGAEMKKEVQK